MADEKKISFTGDQLVEAYRHHETELNSLQQQIGLLQNLLQDTVSSRETLQELVQCSEKQKILVSLGSGVYIDAALDSVKKVKTTIAGGVLIDSKTEDALRQSDEKIEVLKKELNALALERQKTIQALESLGQIISQANAAERAAVQKALKPQQV